MLSDRSAVGRACDRLDAWVEAMEARHGGWVTPALISVGAFGLVALFVVAMILWGPRAEPLKCPQGTHLEAYYETIGRVTRVVYRCGP